MLNRIDDLRITQVRPLLPPAILLEEIPITDRAADVVAATRQAIADVLTGADPRLVVVVGPCSIHDTKAAVDYASRLLPLKERKRATSWASPGASARALRYCRRAPARSPRPSSVSPR